MTRGAGLEDLWTVEERQMTQEQEEGGIKRALVIAAHPDDADFGAAGTAALWTQTGEWEFYYLVCTDGSKGTGDPDMNPHKLIGLRRQEQREAARILGVKDVFFLDNVDGELQYTRDFLGDIVRHIRMLKPYAIFTHDPESHIHNNAFFNHPDHRRTGEVTLDAVYPTARDHLNFPQQIADGLETHKVREVYIWGSEKANYSVDITDVVDTKIDALLAHKTQFAERQDFVEFARERWRDESGRYLERYRQVVMLR